MRSATESGTVMHRQKFCSPVAAASARPGTMRRLTVPARSWLAGWLSPRSRAPTCSRNASTMPGSPCSPLTTAVLGRAAASHGKLPGSGTSSPSGRPRSSSRPACQESTRPGSPPGVSPSPAVTYSGLRPVTPGSPRRSPRPPAADGLAAARNAARYTTPLALVRLTRTGLLDAVGGLGGRQPRLVPLASEPADVAVLTTPDARDSGPALNPGNAYPGWR